MSWRQKINRGGGTREKEKKTNTSASKGNNGNHPNVKQKILYCFNHTIDSYMPQVLSIIVDPEVTRILFSLTPLPNIT